MIFEVIEIVFGAFLIVMSALSVAQKDVVRSIIFLLLFLSIMAANFISKAPYSSGLGPCVELALAQRIIPKSNTMPI